MGYSAQYPQNWLSLPESSHEADVDNHAPAADPAQSYHVPAPSIDTLDRTIHLGLADGEVGDDLPSMADVDDVHGPPYRCPQPQCTNKEFKQKSLLK